MKIREGVKIGMMMMEVFFLFRRSISFEFELGNLN